ncbi:RNA 2'-phosphotransferase [Flammeovirgaceae bacterium SG7u.111]|nr:RNA 2'-phosphotransferase [Flammeovirgaceae bacterium SG7u.132]WPO37310.1 RNA 2'-phosphotransferase [Flammeovirgaceae bacterium SG7u.111]
MTEEEKRLKRLGKFLSLVLRHKPEAISISLDENGWADVDELLTKVSASGRKLDQETLEKIVETNNKKRYAFDESKTKIRASQGHSIDVDLEFEPIEPPTILFHGTAEKNVASILGKGLEKRNRQHVHLSKDVETAVQVGSRHGKPVVLEVLAGEMTKAGHQFFLSANGVWLTDAVPAEFLKKKKD